MSSVTRATKSSKGIPLIVLLPVMAVVGVLLGSGNPLTTIKSWIPSTTQTTVVKTTKQAVTPTVNYVVDNVDHASASLIKLNKIGYALDTLTAKGNQCVRELSKVGDSAFKQDYCEYAATVYWELDDDRKNVISYIKAHNLQDNTTVMNKVVEVVAVLDPVQRNQVFISSFYNK